MRKATILVLVALLSLGLLVACGGGGGGGSSSGAAPAPAPGRSLRVYCWVGLNNRPVPAKVKVDIVENDGKIISSKEGIIDMRIARIALKFEIPNRPVKVVAVASFRGRQQTKEKTVSAGVERVNFFFSL